jgi:hypothetical protein
MAISAFTFWLAGYPDQALICSHEALAVADKQSHGYVSAVTRLFCGFFCANCRRTQDALEHTESDDSERPNMGF